MGNKQVLTGYIVKYQVVYSDGSLGDFYQRRDIVSKDKQTAIIALHKYLSLFLCRGEPNGTTLQFIDCDTFPYDTCDIMEQDITT